MSNIDKVVLEDIKDLLMDWRRDIEDEMIKVEKFSLWGQEVEFLEKDGEDPIVIQLHDLLPKDKKDRKTCLEMLKEFCEEELSEL